MMHAAPINSSIPPRRNELGAHLNRLETLALQTLACSEKLGRLQLSFSREWANASLEAGRQWLSRNGRGGRASGPVPELPALRLDQYLAQVQAIGAELQAAWRRWSDATLTHSGEEWVRLFSAPAAGRANGAFDLMRAPFLPAADGAADAADAAAPQTAAEGARPARGRAAAQRALIVS